MTGADKLNTKTIQILKAIHGEGRPLQTGDIERRTGIARQSIAKHIRWNMLYKLVEVTYEERQKNGHWIRFYGLTPAGHAKLEAYL